MKKLDFHLSPPLYTSNVTKIDKEEYTFSETIFENFLKYLRIFVIYFTTPKMWSFFAPFERKIEYIYILLRR